MTERLKGVDRQLFIEVREVLNKNLSERHIRGGIATRNKYLHKIRHADDGRIGV